MLRTYKRSANFAYILNSAKFPGGIQAVLNLMDAYGNTKLLANPQLAALDNQKATIKVGDRIPICASMPAAAPDSCSVTTMPAPLAGRPQ